MAGYTLILLIEAIKNEIYGTLDTLDHFYETHNTKLGPSIQFFILFSEQFRNNCADYLDKNFVRCISKQ